MRYPSMAVALTALLATACVTAPTQQDTPPVREPGATPQPDRPAADPALRIGVILTTGGTGALRQYSDAVLEGVRVGAEQGADGRDVELVIEDDGGSAAGAAAAVRRLQESGVRAIVGPLSDDALSAAAQARSGSSPVLVSPMAIADIDGLRNVYALNVVDARGAAALGEYARRYSRVGVLHARTPDGERQGQAFIDAYGGRGTVTRMSYQPGTANLANELNQLRNADVEALYVPGTDRDLQMVLPQVEYFDLMDAQILGNDSYIGDAARGLPQRVVQGAIVATSLVRESRELGWLDFVEAYETRYRRSLPSPIPALGYDAVRLAVQLAGGQTSISGYRGATGLITVRDDAISRQPFLVRLDAGRLIPVN